MKPVPRQLQRTRPKKAMQLPGPQGFGTQGSSGWMGVGGSSGGGGGCSSAP